jgi:transcriptional regulator with XRE-family HTH domain
MTWTYQQQLKEARIRAKLTQDEAARLVGVKERTWGSWERGTHDPTEENLRAIVSQLQIPPDLVGYEPPRGWELVPAEWIRAQFALIIGKLDDLEPA